MLDGFTRREIDLVEEAMQSGKLHDRKLNYSKRASNGQSADTSEIMHEVQMDFAKFIDAVLTDDHAPGEFWTGHLRGMAETMSEAINKYHELSNQIYKLESRESHHGVTEHESRTELQGEQQTNREILKPLLIAAAEITVERQHRHKLEQAITSWQTELHSAAETTGGDENHPQHRVIKGFREAAFYWSLKLPLESEGDVNFAKEIFKYVGEIPKLITEESQAVYFYQGFCEKFRDKLEPHIKLPLWEDFELYLLGLRSIKDLQGLVDSLPAPAPATISQAP